MARPSLGNVTVNTIRALAGTEQGVEGSPDKTGPPDAQAKCLEMAQALVVAGRPASPAMPERPPQYRRRPPLLEGFGNKPL